MSGNDNFNMVEIEDLLANLSKLDKKKLLILYHQLDPQRIRWAPDDLLQQVISEVFAGRRSWRRDLPPLVFLRGAGKSILWRELQKQGPELSAHRHGLSDIDVGDTEPDASAASSEEDQVAIDKAVAEIVLLFDETKDATVLCLIREKLNRAAKKSILITCKLTEAMYLAAEAKLKYRVFKNFPEGLRHWGISK